MKTYLPIWCLLASLLVGGMVRPAHAQFSQRRSFSGVVIGSSRAMLSNTVVTLEDLDHIQKSSANTDRGGHYKFAQLMIGNDRSWPRSSISTN